MSEHDRPDLTGKVALVTGGSRGLGEQMVLAFARAGADVIITSRKLESCEAVAQRVREETGRRAFAVASHVGQWTSMDELAEASYAEFGTIDVLVNNAGMSPLFEKLADVPEALYDKVFDVNLKGAFRLSALVGQRMVETGGGSIINVSSYASLSPQPYFLPYAAAKAGLNALTVGFARAYGPTVRVNTLLAGPFRTDVAAHWPEDTAERHRRTYSLQRAGEPEEVVGAALFLASDMSSFSTGGIIRVDGGAAVTTLTRVVPDEILLARLAEAARRWSPGAGVDDIRPVSGGASSLTYTVRLTDSGTSRTCYVKVAPAGLEPVRNRDVLRQAFVQRILGDDGAVPVPPILFTDAGDPPDTPPLFVSAAVAGESVEPLVDRDPCLPRPEVLTARTLAAVQTLARLHQVDVGLAALPREGAQGCDPGVDLGAEVERWARVFATVDPELAAAGEACAARLRERLPAPLAPALVHGDFRLGNLVCVDDEVRAVLDWEIWSVTDPRIDLGWFLMTLTPDGLPSARRRSAPGLPGPEMAMAEYEQARQASFPDMAWFGSLSRFRAAAAMSLNVKHNRRRPQPDPAIERYAGTLRPFLEAGTALLG